MGGPGRKRLDGIETMDRLLEFAEEELTKELK